MNGGDPLPPATSGLPSAQGAIEVIDQLYPSDPQIWLTEAGVWLTNSGKAGVTSVCGDGNPADDGTWLACLNRNPTAQALAAEGYLRLPSESSQITRVYYYDFNNQNVGWDSGLVNLNPGLAGASGYGTPRMAWCVLHNFAEGETPGVAEANAVRPGSACDNQNPHDATYAPVVAEHFIAGAPPVPVAVEPPGEVGRDCVDRRRGRADVARVARAGDDRLGGGGGHQALAANVQLGGPCASPGQGAGGQLVLQRTSPEHAWSAIGRRRGEAWHSAHVGHARCATVPGWYVRWQDLQVIARARVVGGSRRSGRLGPGARVPTGGTVENLHNATNDRL